MRFQYFIFLVLLLTINPALAADQKPFVAKSCMLTKSLQIDDLVDRSGKIFVGKFLYAQESRLKGLDVRELHFQLIEPIKGIDSPKEEIVIKEWARMKSPFLGQIKKNKKYVFFFYEESIRGLSSLVGFEQGFAQVEQSNQLKFSKRINLKTKRKSNLALSSSLKEPLLLEVKTINDLKDLCRI